MTATPELPDLAVWLEDRAGELADALALWAGRDDSRAQPEVTRAGHVAVEGIDTMLAALHQARSQLVGEIPVSQDAAAARVDELLRRHDGGTQ